MKIVERSLINAAPEKVWPFIVTPELFCKWNDKIASMEARGALLFINYAPTNCSGS